MLDILFEFALKFLKFSFSISVLFVPIILLICGFIDEYVTKKASEKRYNISVGYTYEVIKFESVRYEINAYKSEICILLDSGSLVCLKYDRLDIDEVKLSERV